MNETTFFAAAERAPSEVIATQLRAVVGSSVTDGILKAADGLLAILNDQRQVLCVNEQLLSWLGVGSAEQLLSLRLGEVVGCVHAHEAPAGCGTTRYCQSCGQAIATVTALRTGEVIERKCVVKAEREGAALDLCFSVRACPIEVGGEKFLAVFLRDITEEQRLAASERLILHDLGNLLNGLQFLPLASREAPVDPKRIDDWAATMNRLLGGMARTLRLHRALVNGNAIDYVPVYADIRFDLLFEDVRAAVTRHPAALGKKLHVERMINRTIRTDHAAAARVMLNMLLNACEATAPGGEVRITAGSEPGHVRFSVWNERAIPPALALRVFQRNFSTHPESGRGLGTVSMKMLGEDMLGGDVHFSSNPLDGTTFVFRLPVAPPADRASPASPTGQP